MRGLGNGQVRDHALQAAEFERVDDMDDRELPGGVDRLHAWGSCIDAVARRPGAASIDGGPMAREIHAGEVPDGHGH